MQEKGFGSDTRCPWCFEPHGSLAGAGFYDGVPPRPGDVVVCILCANPSILRDDGILRRPLALEMGRMLSNPVVSNLIKAARRSLDRQDGRWTGT